MASTINTTALTAICVANMLQAYLAAVPQILITPEIPNDARQQNSNTTFTFSHNA